MKFPLFKYLALTAMLLGSNLHADASLWQQISQTLHLAAGGDTAPTSADAAFTIDEDTSKVFNAADFPFDDTDGDILHSITITRTVAAGALTLGGSDVTDGQQIAAADIGDLRFTPLPNANGTPYATFGFSVSDGNQSSAAHTATLNVTPVAEVWEGDSRFTTDDDLDGIPDEWEVLMHGAIGVIDATSDSDGDGYSDWAEFERFLAHADPNTAASSRNEAQRRIPPMIEVLEMPEQLEAGQTYTVSWKVLGYDEGYTTLIALFDCTGLGDTQCGSTFSQNFYFPFQG